MAMRSLLPDVFASSSTAGCRVGKLQQSSAYDVVMRVPMLAWSTFLALTSVSSLEEYMRAADPALPGGLYMINIAMRLSVIAYLLILAATVVVRMAPVGKARGVEPRISALMGTFLITAVVLFPRRELSLATGLLSTLLVLAGDAFAIYVLIQLRRSFSIMPEARELVTSGPYLFVRHPLYLAEEIATIGSVIQFLSVWTVVLLAVQIAFQLRRIRNEETVLTGVFPEYAWYKRKTAGIIPGIY
jgi:protein-S-isoprenylcysteine O-methyltransferase Ste14